MSDGITRTNGTLPIPGEPTTWRLILRSLPHSRPYMGIIDIAIGEEQGGALTEDQQRALQKLTGQFNSAVRAILGSEPDRCQCRVVDARGARVPSGDCKLHGGGAI